LKLIDFLLNLTTLELQSLGLLPGEDFTTEVSVGGGLLEDGVLQLEVLDNAARSEVEVLLDNLHQLLLALGACAVIKQRQREAPQHRWRRKPVQGIS